jgi:ABC-type multidrug transport system fused ATPase/permease subunit
MIGDWGTAIFNALANAVNLILTFIPRLLGFLVILGVGLLVAWLVSKALTAILRRVGFDRMANRIGVSRFEQRMGVSLDPAGVLGKIVYWFIVLIFLVPAADALGLPTVSSTLNTLVTYIPNVFVAILVLFLGTLLATFVADLVRGATATARVGNPGLFANLARWSIIGFAALIAFNQLQIGQSLVNILFIAIMGGLALAFGLAFGLGGREFAQRWLARGESSMTTAAAQYCANRTIQQANAEADAQRERVRAYEQQQQMAQAQAAQARAYEQQPAYSQPTSAQQTYPSDYPTQQTPMQQAPA